MLKASVIHTGTSPTLADIKRRIEARMHKTLDAAVEAADAEMDCAFTQGPASGVVRPSGRGKGHRRPKLKHPKAFGNASAERGPMHQASAPGEAPHEDTGDLRTSKKVDKSKNHGLTPSVSVGWSGKDAPKAAALDQGNKKGTLAPRPYRDRAQRKGIKEIEDEMKFGI